MQFLITQHFIHIRETANAEYVWGPFQYLDMCFIRKVKRKCEVKWKKCLLERSVPKPLLIVPRCEWWWWWNDEMMKWSKSWVFDFYETFICYRGYFKWNFYIRKKVQKNFLMGLKIWWSWGSGFFFFKITAGRTIFGFSSKTF